MSPFNVLLCFVGQAEQGSVSMLGNEVGGGVGCCRKYLSILSWCANIEELNKIDRATKFVYSWGNGSHKQVNFPLTLIEGVGNIWGGIYLVQKLFVFF